MIAKETRENSGAPGAFRLDVRLHELLTKTPQRPAARTGDDQLTLPEPVFPQFPEKLTETHPDDVEKPDAHRRRWTAPLVMRCFRGWLTPYVRSRVLPGDFHPIIAYLFTEWKCNLDSITAGRSTTP